MGSFLANSSRNGDQLLRKITPRRLFRRQLRMSVTKRWPGRLLGKASSFARCSHRSSLHTILYCISREIRRISSKRRYERSTRRVSRGETIPADLRVAFLQRKPCFLLQLSSLIGHFASAESLDDDTRRVEGLTSGTLRIGTEALPAVDIFAKPRLSRVRACRTNRTRRLSRVYIS